MDGYSGKARIVSLQLRKELRSPEKFFYSAPPDARFSASWILINGSLFKRAAAPPRLKPRVFPLIKILIACAIPTARGSGKIFYPASLPTAKDTRHNKQKRH